MGLAGAGALGGVGKGMADLGNTILQAAVADQRLQREDRKIAKPVQALENPRGRKVKEDHGEYGQSDGRGNCR